MVRLRLAAFALPPRLDAQRDPVRAAARVAPPAPATARVPRRARPPRLDREVVDPEALHPDARRALSRDLYEAHSRIFGGVDFAHFVDYVIEPEALRTRVEVFRAEGRIVGYVAVHFYARELEGRRVVVMRSECGLEKAHRGGCAVGGLLAREALRWRALHPATPLWWLGALVHPSSYRAVAATVPGLHPHPDRPTPPALQARLHTMADTFGLERVRHDEPGLREVGWCTLDGPEDRRYWRDTDDPTVGFFLARNPGYGEGHGLVSGACLGWTTLLSGALTFALKQLARRLR